MIEWIELLLSDCNWCVHSINVGMLGSLITAKVLFTVHFDPAGAHSEKHTVPTL